MPIACNWYALRLTVGMHVQLHAPALPAALGVHAGRAGLLCRAQRGCSACAAVWRLLSCCRDLCSAAVTGRAD